MDLKKLFKLIQGRTDLIDSIIATMEKTVNDAQAELLRAVIGDFVDTLEKNEAGNIKNTLVNKRKLGLLDQVYKKYMSESGTRLINAIVTGVSNVLDFNGTYYNAISEDAQLREILSGTRETVRDWLGITAKGQLIENGYLNTLVKNEEIKNKIRDSVFRSVIAQKGYNDVKNDLGDYISGNKDKTGALQRYYRNFVYDTFSQVDRTQNKIVADKLKLGFAIYEGGLVKDSRKFCIAHNGKVFTTDEIALFDITEARPPNYNPFTDLGGYGCRHHLNYIPQAVAFALRPELKKLLKAA